MDVLTAHDQALDIMRELVVSLTSDDLPRPTPCDRWDVTALLGHVIGGNLLFAATANGEPADWDQRDRRPAEADIRDEFERSSDTVTGAFRRDGMRTELLSLPFGTWPGEVAIAVHFVDTLTHSWDLARSLGQDRELPDALVATAEAIVARYPEESWGDGRYFAERREPQPSFTPTQRLVASLGRDPGWRAP